jgi:hypothetical protein
MARKAGTENTRMRLLQRKARDLRPEKSVLTTLEDDPTSSPEFLAYARQREPKNGRQLGSRMPEPPSKFRVR